MTTSEKALIQAAHRAAENQRRQIEMQELTTEIQASQSPVVKAICKDLLKEYFEGRN